MDGDSGFEARSVSRLAIKPSLLPHRFKGNRASAYLGNTRFVKLRTVSSRRGPRPRCAAKRTVPQRPSLQELGPRQGTDVAGLNIEPPACDIRAIRFAAWKAIALASPRTLMHLEAQVVHW